MATSSFSLSIFSQRSRFSLVIFSSLKPLIACPHSPDNVVTVASLKGTKVDQVCIGSCTNSSLSDMLKVAAMLKGKTVAPGVSLSISPGSRQVLSMLADCGALADILASGARVLECACGPCIGMGFSPSSGGVSLRTFNRNFLGRSGTKDGQVYLVSPETAVASALTGYITDPTTIAEPVHVTMPENMLSTDALVESLTGIAMPEGTRLCDIFVPENNGQPIDPDTLQLDVGRGDVMRVFAQLECALKQI